MDGTRPGDRGHELTRWWRHTDGRLCSRSAEGEHARIVPPRGDGWTELDPAEGQRLMQQAAERRRTEREARTAERAQARATDYQALVSMGIPEDTAARLTGHRP